MSAKKPAHIVNEGLLSLTQVGLLSFSVRNSSYLFKLFLRDLLQGVVSQELLDKVAKDDSAKQELEDNEKQLSKISSEYELKAKLVDDALSQEKKRSKALRFSRGSFIFQFNKCTPYSANSLLFSYAFLIFS